MAGLGRKVFTSGDILLASEVQGFLQDQSVMVFDDDAARGSAIPTPTEGMVTFRKDDNALEVFDGSVFAPVGSPPGLVHIERQTFSAVSSFSFSNDVFTSAFDNYKIVMFFNGSANSALIWRGRIAGADTTSANYNHQEITASGTALNGFRLINATSARFAIAGNGVGDDHVTMDIFAPKISLPTRVLSHAGNSNTLELELTASFFKLTTSFDSFSILVGSGNITGEADLYGYAK